MKLQETNYGFEGCLPENRTPFKIKTSAKLFDILSSGIYKDKILAVTRELCCNAYDAHVSAGKKHVPFKLRLPTRLDPTFYVEDEGTGIDPALITEIYWTYGESSKTNSNDQIGALGLGSKSPFAYTKSSFVVKNRYKGVEHTYMCFINEDGMPDGSEVGQETTTNPDGVTVAFAVRPEDITAFHDRADRFFKYWKATLPTFVDHEVNDVLKSKVSRVLEGDGWFLERNDNSYHSQMQAVALQGNVPYPIEFASIPKLPESLQIIASNNFVVTFDMGSINFASSREALQYDERTCANLIARLTEVREEIEKAFRDKVFKKGMTQIKFIRNFAITFSEFAKTIRYQGANFGASTDEWYSELLLGSKLSETVKYDGHVYVIEDLVRSEFTATVKGHQKFGLFLWEQLSRRSKRHYMNLYTKLSYIVSKKIEAKKIYEADMTLGRSGDLDVGNEFNLDWKNPSIAKRGEPKLIDNLLTHAASFNVNSEQTLKITHDEMFFYVNDVGNAGEARFKALELGPDCFFVGFDAKVTPVDVVVADLKKMIDQGLRGAKIKMLSDEEDMRPVIDRVKMDVGTIRAKQCAIIFEASAEAMSVEDDLTVTAKDVETKYTTEKIFKVSDLLTHAIVPYVVKKRSPRDLYDPIGPTFTHSIMNDRRLMAYAAKFLFQDLIEKFTGPGSYKDRDCLNVFVLSEGQIDWLKKRKVNLVPLRALVTDRINALEATEQFRAKVEQASVLKSVDLLLRLFNIAHNKPALKARLTADASSSTLKQLFVTYSELNKTKRTLAEDFAKVFIDRAVNSGSQDNVRAAASVLTEKLLKQYPMFSLASLYDAMKADQAAKAVDYIELMDKQ